MELTFHEGDDRTAFRSATLVDREWAGQGAYLVRVDNTEVTFTATLKSARAGQVDLPTTVGEALIASVDGQRLDGRVAKTFEYAVGTRLLVLHEGKLQDATVEKRLRASTYKLQMTSGAKVLAKKRRGTKVINKRIKKVYKI